MSENTQQVTGAWIPPRPYTCTCKQYVNNMLYCKLNRNKPGEEENNDKLYVQEVLSIFILSISPIYRREERYMNYINCSKESRKKKLVA